MKQWRLNLLVLHLKTSWRGEKIELEQPDPTIKTFRFQQREQVLAAAESVLPFLHYDANRWVGGQDQQLMYQTVPADYLNDSRLVLACRCEPVRWRQDKTDYQYRYLPCGPQELIGYLPEYELVLKHGFFDELERELSSYEGLKGPVATAERRRIQAARQELWLHIASGPVRTAWAQVAEQERQQTEAAALTELKADSLAELGDHLASQLAPATTATITDVLAGVKAVLGNPPALNEQ